MGCYKLEDDIAYLVCPCGLERDFSIHDLVLNSTTVEVPICPECGRILYLHVYDISPEVERKTKEKFRKQHVLNHTIYRKMIDSGKQPKSDLEKPDRARARLAVDTPIVEAELHSAVKKARDMRKAKKQR